MPQGMESWQDSTDSESAVPDFMRPGESYIAPTSGFVLGQILHTPSILTYLPTRAATDRLLRQYLRAVHPVAPCVHMPSFMSTYHAFWDDVDVLMEPRPSVQAVVMAALFSASVSMDDATVSRDFGLAKANLIEGLKTGVEAALSKANFLRTTNVETLQAFVMYMVRLAQILLIEYLYYACDRLSIILDPAL